MKFIFFFPINIAFKWSIGGAFFFLACDLTCTATFYSISEHILRNDLIELLPLTLRKLYEIYTIKFYE